MDSAPMDSAPEVAENLFGNYFVAAYPPFSQWTEEGVESWRERLSSPPDPEVPLGLYLHVPFCAQRCEYCYYLAYANPKAVEVDSYLDALLGELRSYRELPAVAGRPIDFLYFGGGTPSLLSIPRIGRLFAGLAEIVDLDSAREITFECAPRSVTAAKMSALRDAGVTRLSLGVQQLDDGVLESSGRIHRVGDVERAWQAVHGVGFEVVNIDLMVGMVGESEESFERSLQRVIEWQPESVTIYQLEMPHYTPLSRRVRDGSETVASWAVKRARLDRAFSRLEDQGYHLRSAYTAVRDPRKHRFIYQEEQYRGADLLGLGVSAFSYLGGIHHQNLASLAAYLESLASGDLPWGRAYALNEEERLIRELVLQLKLGQLQSRHFEQRFGVEISEHFAEPLERAELRGWLRVADDGVVLTRTGLLRADHLLRDFYLPRHQNVAYA